MQHCGNCGALLSEEELRQGRCAVCLRAVTPDIDTIPADSRQSYQLGQMNAPSSQPFLGVIDDGAEQRLRVSLHGQIAIEHGGGVEVRLPAAPRRRGGWLFLLGALVLLLLAASLAILFIKPGSGGKLALQSQTATMSSNATGTAGAVSATTTAVTVIGGATASPHPGGTPGSATATATSGGTGAGGGSPTSGPEITATPLPTATPAPSNPPALYMNPTAVRFTLCLIATSASFTIKNTGGGTLKWNAISSDYTIQPPTQGTLSANQYTTIMVKGILLGGSVTVNATDLAGHPLPTSPQTFTVVCSA